MYTDIATCANKTSSPPPTPAVCICRCGLLFQHDGYCAALPLLLLLALLLVPVQLSQAMVVLGCQAWDVGAVLTTDKNVSRLNRQVNKGRTTSRRVEI